MAELTTLARPYAVAVFKRAKETSTTQKWSDQLEFLAAVTSDPRMVQAANNPKVKREAFASAFLDLCGNRVDGEGQNFIRVLIDNRRLSLLSEIAELYAKFKAEDEGYIDVDVASAFDMTSAEEKKLTAALDKFLKKKAKLKITVDPNLIGGVYVRAGDHVVDASVRGQIERLAKSLLS
jgi:F-type H+-transporting ATPase subunit delta